MVEKCRRVFVCLAFWYLDLVDNSPPILPFIFRILGAGLVQIVCFGFWLLAFRLHLDVDSELCLSGLTSPRPRLTLRRVQDRSVVFV